jgi:hypothetical protein
VGFEGALDCLAGRLAPLAELRRRLGPGLAVSGKPVGAKLCAERDQRGEVCNVLDGSGLRHANEPVRVEVVAEQQRRVVILGREETRPAVVEEVALVDRLEPEGVELLGERGEDRLALPLVLRPECVAPEPALGRRLLRDRLPQVDGYSQPASSFVQ